MSEKKITIRLETKDDYRNVENLTREAFWNVYRPGCMEYYVLHCYRDDPAFVPELDFVMELDGELIGQVIYVRSEIDCDDGRKVLPGHRNINHLSDSFENQLFSMSRFRLTSKRLKYLRL